MLAYKFWCHSIHKQAFLIQFMKQVGGRWEEVGNHCLLSLDSSGNPTRERKKLNQGRLDRRSDEDDYGHWYAVPDIDRKAKEYIEKIHRQMQLEKKNMAE
ncbi:hypothetical protein BHE74_00027053 [Ensete ventricosum]|nr:hypothetical protein GW17_00007850 [Ensete ventricosum]RWW65634.1 hypothetical protein BHE74_00027053 [Ensete ventricosum]RZR92900.1 hypothetical protein BHM03_00021277 [Ensete ventricosum]